MAKLTKKQFKDLSGKLIKKSPTVWEEADAKARKAIFAAGERCKEFLDKAKTERLAVKYIQAMAEEKGFKPISGRSRGKKFFSVFQDKAIALVALGSQKPSKGMRILGSHLDAPRLDLKMNPLYENQELVFLKTQYYGGIKKYHWFSRPMAILGVVCTTDGRTVEIQIGEGADEPVFTVPDLLPHLSRKGQGSKKLNEAFEAERMNLLIGGLPVDAEEGSDKAKLAVLRLLEERYGIHEADLVSAELEIVPAGPARDVGLDRALIGAYGQDDRASSFASMEAVLGLANPKVCCLSLFVDKEEIGSDGSTSARGRFLELLTARILAKAGEEPSYLNSLNALASSQAISADVNAAFDPDYPEVHEKLNAAYLGHGISLTKYTGSGGKYGASDANAEYLGWLRGVWNEAKVVWQAAAMGKVDEGGGGTIAKLLAVHGMEIVDAGPAVLSMHSPFEISHKADIYSTIKAFEAFFKAGPR